MLGGLVAVSLLGGAIVVAALVARLDADASLRSVATARGVISSLLHAQASSAYNTGRWDDATQHLYGDLDRAWARSNISGEYVAYVIDARGRTLFAQRSDGTIDPPLGEVAPAALRSMLDRLPRSFADADRMKEGIAFFDQYRGRTAIFGVMPVIPLSKKVAPPRGELRHLIYIDMLTPARVTSLATRYGLTGLRVDARGTPSSVALANLRGDGVAALAWTPEHPGSAGLKAILPILLVIAGAVLALTWALDRVMRRQQAELASSNEQFQAMAREAERAAERAEAARREADLLRDRAEAAAKAEARERERSAAALKQAARSTGMDLQAHLVALVEDLARLAGQLDETADAAWAATQAQETHANWVGAKSANAAASLDDVLSGAAGMANAVQSIRQEVASTRDAVASAARHSSETAVGNEALLSHVDGIGSASEAILTVTKKTRQLAVNAAIVAAHGQSAHDGFSVIAREIKTLSENSRLSAGQIADRLKAVTESVHRSVDASLSIDSDLQNILESISAADAAVRAHEAAGAAIVERVHHARHESHAVGGLVREMNASIAHVRDSVQLTREVSARVRERVELLERALGKAVSDLMAA
ncbi:hypothetical protein [Rhizorhabdus phycosphaerae]|uniref:hypothetical protein n=1 Tax=Rhizorhabdus phycosphaerae TaxID=2711156 RepID=UPI0019D11332|nr:hypothetical protein [Rhizorhabdus phycosphaerae]